MKSDRCELSSNALIFAVKTFSLSNFSIFLGKNRRLTEMKNKMQTCNKTFINTWMNNNKLLTGLATENNFDSQTYFNLRSSTLPNSPGLLSLCVLVVITSQVCLILSQRHSSQPPHYAGLISLITFLLQHVSRPWNSLCSLKHLARLFLVLTAACLAVLSSLIFLLITRPDLGSILYVCHWPVQRVYIYGIHCFVG